MTVTLAISTGALADGQTANGADVTTPLNEIVTHLQNIANGAQNVEQLLLPSLSAQPATPGAGYGKLYLQSGILYSLNDTGTATAIATIGSTDTTYILSAQVFS